MALPPQLNALREQLTKVGYANRSSEQDALLAELGEIDKVIVRKSLDESTFASSITSQAGGMCRCCGR